MRAIRKILGLKPQKAPRARFTRPGTLTIAAGVFLLLTATTGTASASAAGVQPATSYHMCLKYASSLCMEANGVGKQVTITPYSNDYMDVRVAVEETCYPGSGGTGYTCFEFEDGSGNCLSAASNQVVVVAKGCNFYESEAWVETSPYEYKSFLFWSSDILLTRGDVNGDNVWHSPTASGDFARWTVD